MADRSVGLHPVVIGPEPHPVIAYVKLVLQMLLSEANEDVGRVAEVVLCVYAIEAGIEVVGVIEAVHLMTTLKVIGVG